ncbi:hypothetical protein BC937DRAFT_90331 [Endogone sp. FLAS-F59071]|nr:hypothetical protein BC937DRAFT_90331 [Endogone sp. FLAS-F59071]|eukprot:RUS17157.1 hypothetical protein BC937DRAFT_90331 [Endogone sp. FLAS-F59071]
MSQILGLPDGSVMTIESSFSVDGDIKTTTIRHFNTLGVYMNFIFPGLFSEIGPGPGISGLCAMDTVSEDPMSSDDGSHHQPVGAPTNIGSPIDLHWSNLSEPQQQYNPQATDPHQNMVPGIYFPSVTPPTEPATSSSIAAQASFIEHGMPSKSCSNPRSVACDRCNKRKEKCIRDQNGKCYNCVKNGNPCTERERKRKRNSSPRPTSKHDNNSAPQGRVPDLNSLSAVLQKLQEFFKSDEYIQYAREVGQTGMAKFNEAIAAGLTPWSGQELERIIASTFKEDYPSDLPNTFNPTISASNADVTPANVGPLAKLVSAIIIFSRTELWKRTMRELGWPDNAELSVAPRGNVCYSSIGSPIDLHGSNLSEPQQQYNPQATDTRPNMVSGGRVPDPNSLSAVLQKLQDFFKSDEYIQYAREVGQTGMAKFNEAIAAGLTPWSGQELERIIASTFKEDYPSDLPNTFNPTISASNADVAPANVGPLAKLVSAIIIFSRTELWKRTMRELGWPDVAPRGLVPPGDLGNSLPSQASP